MFDWLTDVTVTEKGSFYEIAGITVKYFSGDLKTAFGTTVIASRVIKQVSSNKFRIHKFFTVELAMVLDSMINNQNKNVTRYYRVGINKYNKLFELLKQTTWIKTTFEKFQSYDVDKACRDFTFSPYPTQREFLEQYSQIKYGFQLRGVLLDAVPGSGKANALSSDILTPNGFVKMGDIDVGDYVIGQNGKPTRVTAIYPQGKVQLYNVRFKDGRQEKCCIDHLWTIKKKGITSTVNTASLISHFKESKEAVFVPFMENNYDGFVEDDRLIQNPFYIGVELAKNRLDSIPVKYMNSSKGYRLSILQGFVEVLGEISDNRQLTLRIDSKKVLDQIQYLVRSLGGTALCVSDNVLDVALKDTRSLFRTHPIDLPTLVNNDVNGLEMVSVTLAEEDYAQCITVDAKDSLYVCTDFIVTHNTFTSLVWSRMVSSGKTILLVPKHLVLDPWVDHLSPEGKRYCFKKPPKYWTSLDKSNPLESDAEFLIFYTENIRKDEWDGISFEKILSTLSKGGKEPLKMIIDESHRYNELSSQQTQGMIDFASSKYISDVLFSSGTPIKAQGKETYPLFCVIDKYFDNYVRDDFVKLYSRDNYFLNEMLAHRLGRIKFTIEAIEGMDNPPEPVLVPIKFPGVEQYTLKAIRAEMVDYIQGRLLFYKNNLPNYWYDFNEYLLRYENTIKSEEDLVELKHYRDTIDYFRKYGYNNFTDSDKSKFCKKVETKITAGLKGEDLHYFRHIAPAIKYVGLKIRGEALGNVLGKARQNAVKAVIEHANIPQLIASVKKKTVIYSTYIDAIKYTDEYLSKEGLDPVLFYSESTEPVDDILRRFSDNEKINPLITTFDSLSEGKPLLMANQLILLNSPWRQFQLKQVIARVHRKGQTEKCFIWMLDLDTGTEENVTSRSIDIMEYYTKIVDQLLGGGNGFDTGLGISTRAITEVERNIEDLVPFEIPFISYRPRLNTNSFTSMFR